MLSLVNVSISSVVSPMPKILSWIPLVRIAFEFPAWVPKCFFSRFPEILGFGFSLLILFLLSVVRLFYSFLSTLGVLIDFLKRHLLISSRKSSTLSKKGFLRSLIVFKLYCISRGLLMKRCWALVGKCPCWYIFSHWCLCIWDWDYCSYNC